MSLLSFLTRKESNKLINKMADKVANKDFWLGHRTGYEEGFNDCLKSQIESGRIKTLNTISDEKYKKFIDFMIENELEVYYSLNNNGLFVCYRDYKVNPPILKYPEE